MKYDDFMFEYDNTGKVVYIVDMLTAKGYRVSGNINDDILKNFLNKIRRSRNTDIGSIPRWLKFVNSKTSNFSSKKMINILLITYTIFVLSNMMILLSGTYNLIPWNYNFFNSFTSIQVIMGILLFVAGLLIVHEGSHILISIVQGIPVSKLGFKIKYGFVPMVYVRLFPTSYRNKQLNIAFAGLVADQILIFLYLVTFKLTNSNFFQISIILQLVLTVFNYNLLFPSDFTQMILSKINYLSFRREAFLYTFSLLKMKLSFIPSKINFIKIVYVTLFYIFLIVMIINLINIIFWFIGEIYV